MPTVIDSLTLELNLDTSKWTAGQRDAVESLRKFEEQSVRGGKEIESQGKKLTEFFQGIKRQAIEVLGLFAGATGVKDFIKDITTMNTTLGYSAQRLGVSAKEIAGWEGALQRIGAPVGTATAAFTGLNEAIRTWTITGQISPGLSLFNRIGGFTDASGNIKDLGEMYKSMAEYSQQTYKTDAARVNFLMKLPGMNEQMATFLLKPRPEMEKMVAESEQASKIDPEGVKAAEKFTDRWNLAKQAITGAGTELMKSIYGPLTMIADKMNEIATNHTWAGVAMNFVGQVASGVGGTAGTILAYLAATRFGGAIAGGAGAVARGAGRLALGAASFPFAAAGFYFGSTEMANADEGNRNWWEPLAGPGGASPSSMRVKPGAGSSSDTTLALMAALTGVAGIKEITSLNDSLHRRIGARDPHAQGRAMDLTITDPSQSASVADKIRAKLAEAGINAKVTNEYLHPSANATGGHIHVTAHIGEVNVNAPNAKNANDATAEGVHASLKRSVTAGGANWNPP